MTTVKNLKYNKILLTLLPAAMIMLQGLYTSLQCALALPVCLLAAKRLNLSARQIICAAVMYAGMILSDIISANNPSYIHEGLNVMLLLCGMSVAAGEDRPAVLRGTYIGCSVSSLAGIIAYIFRIDSFGMINTVDGELVLQGALGYANTMALFCGIGIIISLYYIGKKDKFQFAHECVFVLNLVAFILTKSLFGCVCLVAGAVIAIYVKYAKIRGYIICSGIVLVLFVIGLFAAGYGELLLGSTVACRLIYWQDAMLLVLDNPLGIGVNNWQWAQYSVQTANYSVKYVHNGFIQLLLDGGIVSLAAFVLLLVTCCRSVVKRCHSEQGREYLYILAALSFLLLHSFTDVNFAYGAVWFVMGALLSCGDKGSIRISWVPQAVIIVAMCILVLLIPESQYTNQYAASYTQAAGNNDYAAMDEISAAWLIAAPRQQDAYDARYYALYKLGDDDGLAELREQKEQVNSSMNKLCVYLDSHKEIVLPEVTVE